jgi:hypothetical protein
MGRRVIRPLLTVGGDVLIGWDDRHCALLLALQDGVIITMPAGGRIEVDEDGDAHLEGLFVSSGPGDFVPDWITEGGEDS